MSAPPGPRQRASRTISCTRCSLSYDNNGNLFVDGEQIGSSGFVLAELARRQHAMTDIFLNQSIGIIPGVQSDAKHLVIGDARQEPFTTR